MRHLAITEQSLQRLNEVVTDFLTAFAVAAAGLESQGHLE